MGALRVSITDRDVHAAGDGELVEELSRGGTRARSAFAAIYERHASTVLRWLFARLRNRSLAEDALQEVFFVLWKKRHRVDLPEGASSLLPWLLVTARYEALSSARKNPSHTTLVDERVDRHARLGEGPEEKAQQREQLASVAAVVASLSSTDRQIFEACVLGELSYAEAAQFLGIQTGAVRNRLSRLRRRLVQEIGPQRAES